MTATMVTASDPGHTEALRRYQLLADSCRDIILYLRPSDGRIVEANSAAIAAYGYSREELLERTIYDIRRQDAPEEILRQMMKAEQGSIQYETVHYRKDGSAFPVEVVSQGAGEGDERVLIKVVRNLTPRRQAQAALESSEERMRLAIEAAGIGTYDFDVPGNRISSSPELCDMVGLPHGSVLSLERATAFVHPGDRELVEAALALSMDPRGDGLVTVEFRISTLSGTYRVLRWAGRTAFESTPEGRRPLRQVGCVMDITERSRAEAEARQWQHAFEHAEIPIAIVDSATGTFHAVNPAYARQHGYTQAELAGRPIFTVIPPEERPRIRAIVDQISAGPGHVSFEAAHWRKDGGRFPVLVDLTVEADEHGRPGRRIMYVHDLTEQKRAQEDLRRSEALYRAVARSIPDAAVLVVNSELRFIVIEGSAALRFGFARDRMEGRLVADVYDDQWSREATLEMYRRALGGEWLDADREHRGRQVWTHFVPLSDDSGRVVGALSLWQDITERKRVEEQLRQAQKLESVGLLAGGIAHDFNNLLVGVIGNASLLHDSLPPQSPLRGTAALVVQAGQQAAQLTRQLLAYAGKGRFVVTPVDLSDVVLETKPLIEDCIPKEVYLDLRLDNGIPPVEGDRSQMQQILMSLAMNAAEAIGEQSGTIRVYTGETSLDQALIRREFSNWPVSPGSFVFLEVRDTGCGMEPAIRSRIFEPFFSTKFQGRGLGLAAVAGIVRSHKGAIQVNTTPGAGSTFRVLLPAAAGRQDR